MIAKASLIEEGAQVAEEEGEVVVVGEED